MIVSIQSMQVNRRFARFALEPFRTAPDRESLARRLGDADQALDRLLAAEGLAALWYDWIVDHRAAVPREFLSHLRVHRHTESARCLLQRTIARRVCRCLTETDIRCAVFKGVAARERLYDDPSLRPADDVDIIVDPEHVAIAIQTLSANGFLLQPDRRNLSHEVMLHDDYTTIDLHWHILRPGRCRIDLSRKLLDTLKSQEPFPVLSGDADLLVMLVHPAITNYINGRTSKLIRVVDLDRTLRTTQPDWDWILPLISAAGLRTAAWAVLYWQRSLLDTPVDPTVLRYLEPGRLQRRYLTSWIDHRLTARLDVVPGLVQWGFTLALHERPGDALRFIVQRAKAGLEAGSILKQLQQISRTPD